MAAKGTSSMGNYTSLRRGDADRSNLHDDAVGQMYAKRRTRGWEAHRHEGGADEARSSRTPRRVSIEFAVYSALTDSPWNGNTPSTSALVGEPSAVRSNPDSRI